MKSFSRMTKEELRQVTLDKNCCIRAALVGMLLYGGELDHDRIQFNTENEDVLEVYLTLCGRYGFAPVITKGTEKIARYTATYTGYQKVLPILCDLGFMDRKTGVISYCIASVFGEKPCCRRALIRGAFLAGGTVIDPKKHYNLELVTNHKSVCDEMKQLLMEEQFIVKDVNRKGKQVLYLKNSEAISDFLSYLGAFKAQMELLNVKIVKEIRNDFNRTANSETANLEKTINASVQQVKAIELLQKKGLFHEIPEDLQEIALLRLAHKEMSLGELGALMQPPLSKSGVNHRMKRILELAKKE